MRRLLTACALGLLAATTACGGGSDKEAQEAKATPPASAAINGTYAASGVLTSSSDRTAKVGPASKEDLEFVFQCVDESCNRVFQRSSAPGAFTRLFAVAGDTWTSKRTDNGACTAPAEGTYANTEVWTWKRSAAGSMEGNRENTVVGCKQDGTTRFTYSVTGKTADLPYVDGAEAAAVKKVITDYDTGVKPVYDMFAKCNEDYYDDKRFETGAACFSQLFTKWTTELKELGAALDQNPVPSPRGTCQKAFESITADGTSPLDKILTAVSAMPPALAAAGKSGDYEAATKKLDATLALQDPFQEALLGVAMQCIAPDDLDGLGQDGVLATDPNKTITAPVSS